MKTHTNNFKTNISTNGRELDSKITYTINGTTTVLGVEDLNSITPHYKGDILKSVMKQLDIDSNVDISIGTVINYQFGVKVGNAYEYLDFGNYIVYSSEKQEDLDSYEIIAYDKLLYSMKDYESLGITYPISIRNYINALCTKIGLTFANSSDTFCNYNRMIQSELYLTNDNKSLGYKYRDVLDELAQVTASTICINNNDELELRYITQTNDTIDEEFFKDINVSFGEKYGPVNSIVLSRSAGSDNVETKDDQSIAQNGLCQIVIKDNQIMNWEDRTDYLPDLLNALDGLEYYLNDYYSYGIMYYDLCDRYNVQIGNNTYSCVMLNDEANITKDLEEYISTIKPIVSKEEYSNTKKEEIKENRTDIIVDQANKSISQIVSSVGDNGQVTAASIITAINNDTSQVDIQADKINLNGAVTANNNFVINQDGSVEMNDGTIDLIDNGTSETVPKIKITSTNSTLISQLYSMGLILKSISDNTITDISPTSWRIIGSNSTINIESNAIAMENTDYITTLFNPSSSGVDNTVFSTSYGNQTAIKMSNFSGYGKLEINGETKLNGTLEVHDKFETSYNNYSMKNGNTIFTKVGGTVQVVSMGDVLSLTYGETLYISNIDTKFRPTQDVYLKTWNNLTYVGMHITPLGEVYLFNFDQSITVQTNFAVFGTYVTTN